MSGRDEMRNKYAPVIPKAELVKGAYYFGRCRNAPVARWDGTHFWYWRQKGFKLYLERICAPEDDAINDVFVATGILDIPLQDGNIPLQDDWLEGDGKEKV